jgi:hypothetical protein
MVERHLIRKTAGDVTRLEVVSSVAAISTEAYVCVSGIIDQG